jgi:hypothetical protein
MAGGAGGGMDDNTIIAAVNDTKRTVHSWPCRKRGYHDEMEIVYRGRKQHVAVCHRCDHMEIRDN